MNKDSRNGLGNSENQKYGNEPIKSVLNKTKSMNFIFRKDLKPKRKILQNELNSDLPNLCEEDSF